MGRSDADMVGVRSTEISLLAYFCANVRRGTEPRRVMKVDVLPTSDRGDRDLGVELVGLVRLADVVVEVDRGAGGVGCGEAAVSVLHWIPFPHEGLFVGVAVVGLFGLSSGPMGTPGWWLSSSSTLIARERTRWGSCCLCGRVRTT